MNQQAWVVKEAAIVSAKSQRIKIWLRETFNEWVPCKINAQLHPHTTEKIYVEFHPPRPGTPFRLLVPIKAVNVRHHLLVNSVPLELMPEVRIMAKRLHELLDGKDRDRWLESLETK